MRTNRNSWILAAKYVRMTGKSACAWLFTIACACGKFENQFRTFQNTFFSLWYLHAENSLVTVTKWSLHPIVPGYNYCDIIKYVKNVVSTIRCNSTAPYRGYHILSILSVTQVVSNSKLSWGYSFKFCRWSYWNRKCIH